MSFKSMMVPSRFVLKIVTSGCVRKEIVYGNLYCSNPWLPNGHVDKFAWERDYRKVASGPTFVSEGKE